MEDEDDPPCSTSRSKSTKESTPNTTLTDLDTDSLVQCASFLNLPDLSNLSLTCKYLQRVSYSDSIWRSLFRERWPQLQPSSFSKTPSVREAYLARHIALQQLRFFDPLVADIYTDVTPYNFLYFDNDIYVSQGPQINIWKTTDFLDGRESLVHLRGHSARITCMRSFPLNETSLFRSETQRNDNVLVTSSCDQSIRLWWKGLCQRCFRGHNGPVSTLSDKLLGDSSGKVFASGGVDGTVRLWSLNSSGKRGQHALKATLYGHEKSVVQMSVAGHKTSLLVSISRDSKVRVWDTAASAVRSSCCVGMTSVPGAPVGLKCHESLLYVAAGSSVVAIDLRTMQKAFATPMNQPAVHSLEIMPSKSLICTGGIGRAVLWDTRKSCDTQKAEPVAELDGHVGAVTHLHMDPFKIVTGGPDDPYVNVWEVDTGTRTNSISCSPSDGSTNICGCSAMAVNGYRIVTASCWVGYGVVRYRDYTNASCQVLADETKF